MRARSKRYNKELEQSSKEAMDIAEAVEKVKSYKSVTSIKRIYPIAIKYVITIPIKIFRNIMKGVINFVSGYSL